MLIHAPHDPHNLNRRFTIRPDVQVYFCQHPRIHFPYILIHDYWALHAVARSFSWPRREIRLVVVFHIVVLQTNWSKSGAVADRSAREYVYPPLVARGAWGSYSGLVNEDCRSLSFLSTATIRMMSRLVVRT